VKVIEETDKYKNKPILAITTAAMVGEAQASSSIFEAYITILLICQNY